MSSRVWHRIAPIPSRSRASGCAARSTRTRPAPTASSSPTRSPLTTAARASTCSRSPTTGSGPRRLSNGRLLVLPSVELNCILPAARDGHVLGFGISADADLAALGAEYADLERTAGVHRGARRRRLSRTSLLDRRDSRHARAARERRRDRGLERRLRARGGAGAVLRALGRAARDRPPLLRARDGRLPPSRLRLGPRLDLAARAGADAPRPCSRRSRPGSFYGSSGPLLHDVAVDGDEVEVRCSPARSVTLVSGRTEGAAVNAGRLGYRYAGEVLADRRSRDHARAAAGGPSAPRYARIEVTDATGNRAWTNPL